MKKIRLLAFTLTCFFLTNFTCKNDDVGFPITDCDSFAFVDDSQYDNADSAFFEIISASIEGDCLNIEISSSGCSGETWVMELFSNTIINESLPIQRGIRLVLTNNEACLAVFSKEMSFDLTNLQVEGENEIVFNLEEYSGELNYSY